LNNFKNKNRRIKDLSVQRSLLLYRHAVQATSKGRLDLARRYIELGLKVLSKANTRKPLVYRRWICKRCLVPLIPGFTARIRIHSNRKQIIIVKKCLVCGWIGRTVCMKKPIKG